ncbi:hypothetical protein J6590_059133 [Homalodisca vitripennis]|nr:hypothetical protein J6590_059133 [Homalodisca vitripennis]
MNTLKPHGIQQHSLHILLPEELVYTRSSLMIELFNIGNLPLPIIALTRPEELAHTRSSPMIELPNTVHLPLPIIALTRPEELVHTRSSPMIELPNTCTTGATHGFFNPEARTKHYHLLLDITVRHVSKISG